MAIYTILYSKDYHLQYEEHYHLRAETSFWADDEVEEKSHFYVPSKTGAEKLEIV